MHLPVIIGIKMDICTMEANQAVMRVSYKAHGAKYTKLVSQLSS